MMNVNSWRLHDLRHELDERASAGSLLRIADCVLDWVRYWRDGMSKKDTVEFAGDMTLRDWFAGQALEGYASNKRIMDNAIDDWSESGGRREMCVAEYLAGLAYEVADAMLKARES